MWQGTVGLLNGQYKYLTAESFGHKINSNGHVMKKKQQWSIELFPLTNPSSVNGTAVDELSEVDFVAIKSSLNCYLAVDSYGNVTCDSAEKTDKCRFIITICSMSSGGASEQIYWAFKNVVRNYYLGAGPDGMINCNAKMPQSRAELWHIHLQPARGATCFALRSIGRKRYARAAKVENSVQIKVDSPIAWGESTLFQFRYWAGGQYALFTSDGKLLTSDGKCCVWPKTEEDKKSMGSNAPVPHPNSLFNIEFHSGFVAFRDEQGQYLAGTGHASILKSRSTSVSKDELFELEPAPVQVALRASFNGKWLSIKQGVDLTANQSEIGDEHETFQFEHVAQENQWRIQSKQGNYWIVAGSSIAATCTDSTQAGLFKLHWNEDGSCSLQVSGTGSHSGKWICNRKSGQLCIGALSASPAGNGQTMTEPVAFHLRLQNRKAFYLRSAQASGFVGLKTLDAGKLECAKGFPDALQPVYDEPTSAMGGCLLKMPVNQRFWSIADGNLVRADATTAACAQSWVIELRTATTISIRTADTGLYLNGSAQGALQVIACEPSKATFWEF